MDKVFRVHLQIITIQETELQHQEVMIILIQEVTITDKLQIQILELQEIITATIHTIRDQ